MTFLLTILQVDTFFKVIQLVVISIAKLIIAPPVSIEMGLGYFETVAITAISGIIGIFIFYHLSGLIIKWYRRHVKPIVNRIIGKKRDRKALREMVRNAEIKGASKWKSKNILKKIDKRWGLIGMCSFTLLTIPLVSFFANKYYSKNKYTLVYLSGSVIIWSFVITTLYFFAF